jgi:endonuclease G
MFQKRIINFICFSTGFLFGFGGERVHYHFNHSLNHSPPSDHQKLDQKEKEKEKPIISFPIVISDHLKRSSYSLQYNRLTRNPFWVREELQEEKEEKEELELDHQQPSRSKSKFKEDSTIPLAFRSRLADYHGSGYDRGHLVPAADSLTQKQMNETFLLSNMSPQVASFNRGYWARLEKWVRSIKGFDRLIVYTGPLFLPAWNGEQYRVSYQVLGTPPNTAVPTHVRTLSF